MKTIKSIIGSLCLISLQLKSQSNQGIYVEPGISAGIQKTSFTGGVSGGFGFYLNKKSSLNFGASELFNSGNSNVVSAIRFTYRYQFTKGFFIGGGFAHQHEISAGHYVEEPVNASLGTSSEIHHRSGIIFETGYVFKPLSETGFFSHLVPSADVSASFMLNAGPNPLLTCNLGLRYNFSGKK